LKKGNEPPEAGLIHEVMSFCTHAAKPCHVVATLVRSDYASIYPTSRTVMQVLAVIQDFQPRLMNYVKVIGGVNVSVMGVDQWVFERDVDRGFLGEALAGALVFPYSTLMNEDYFRLEETKLKKRLITELLESLILDFPELSYELHIKPEYFMYETMLTRGRLFPPTLYALADLMTADREDIECSLRGFLEAAKELEKGGMLYKTNGYLRISKEFVDRVRSRKMRFMNLFRTGQRALFTTALGLFPQFFDAVSRNRNEFLKLQKAFLDESKIMQSIEDPENYVYVPTSSGLVSLANRMDIEAYARKELSSEKDAQIKIKSIGGILNDVYSVELLTKDHHRKVVVKRFRDWANFKWFPLTLWSTGTKTFAMAGTSRLEKEWAINRLLDSHGFAVPKLLHISPAERLVVMEYVEGENLSKLVRRVVSAKNDEDLKVDLEIIKKVGATFARVHSLNVALGDTKPENVLVGKHGEICLMDFEQSSRNGDLVWDIAEFMYYSGHYVPPLLDTMKIQMFGEAFVKGYLESGGKAEIVRNAGSPKYTKVFSIFAFPHVIFALSNICRKAKELTA
jgi:tRNA A-37 threonylcarbamoyl transferase component Bud32